MTKIPRFTFEKFSSSPAILGTSMKSVGEAMAIGRNFKESLQKALISLEIGFSGLDRIFDLNKSDIEKKLKINIPNKILLIAEAIRKKINLKKIYKLSKVDPWFLEQIKEIVDQEIKIKEGRIDKESFSESNGGVNQRLWMLANKGQCFRDMVTHPIVDDLVGHLLGKLMYSGSSNGFDRDQSPEDNENTGRNKLFYALRSLKYKNFLMFWFNNAPANLET